MEFNFSFRTLDSFEDINKVVSFIHTRPLDYIGYSDWVEKVRYQLGHAEKMAILAFSNRDLVGDLIYQHHQSNLPFLEIKNLRTEDFFARRGFAEFMVKQAKRIAKEEGYAGVIVDVRSENMPIVNLFQRRGYREVARMPLYDKKAEDVVFVKEIGVKNRIWLPSDKKILENLH